MFGVGCQGSGGVAAHNAFRVAVDVDPYRHETGSDESHSFFSRTVLLREKMA